MNEGKVDGGNSERVWSEEEKEWFGVLGRYLYSTRSAWGKLANQACTKCVGGR